MSTKWLPFCTDEMALRSDDKGITHATDFAQNCLADSGRHAFIGTLAKVVTHTIEFELDWFPSPFFVTSKNAFQEEVQEVV